MTEKGKIVKGAVVINIHLEGSPFHPPQKGDTEKVDIIPDIGQDPKVPVEGKLGFNPKMLLCHFLLSLGLINETLHVFPRRRGSRSRSVSPPRRGRGRGPFTPTVGQIPKQPSELHNATSYRSARYVHR